MNLPLPIQAVDRRNAASDVDGGDFRQRHLASRRRDHPERLEVANGLPVSLVQADPHPHFVAAFLQALRFGTEKALADLVHDRSAGKTKLIRPRFQLHFHLLHAFLVVVRDVLEVGVVHHGRLQFGGGLFQGIQVVAQKRDRHRPPERGERRETQVFCSEHRPDALAHHGADVGGPHVAAFAVEELDVDVTGVHRRPHPLVHRQNHLQRVVALRRQFSVDLPDDAFNSVQFRLGDEVPCAGLHGQVDGEVVALDEREEGGFDLTAPD